MGTEASQATRHPLSRVLAPASEVMLTGMNCPATTTTTKPLDGQPRSPGRKPCAPVSSEPPVSTSCYTRTGSGKRPPRGSLQTRHPRPLQQSWKSCSRPLTLEQIQAQLTEQYALSPDDALAFQTAPETV